LRACGRSPTFAKMRSRNAASSSNTDSPDRLDLNQHPRSPMIHLPAKRHFIPIQLPALYVLCGVNRWLAEGALLAAAI
jgi:hypothetical protein